MTGQTFAELSARPPWSWNGSYVHTGQGWFNGPCPSQAIHDCRPPWLDAPVPEVPEPATSLMLAVSSSTAEATACRSLVGSTAKNGFTFSMAAARPTALLVTGVRQGR